MNLTTAEEIEYNVLTALSLAQEINDPDWKRYNDLYQKSQSDLMRVGRVQIPQEVTDYADTIKYENYKTNTPTNFQIRPMLGGFGATIAKAIGYRGNQLDFVYFSVCKGAEPHTDYLPKFEPTTYVIPVILPKGQSIIWAGRSSVIAAVGEIYMFDHTNMHGMDVVDAQSGCVVVMVGVKKCTS